MRSIVTESSGPDPGTVAGASRDPEIGVMMVVQPAASVRFRQSCWSDLTGYTEALRGLICIIVAYNY